MFCFKLTFSEGTDSLTEGFNIFVSGGMIRLCDISPEQDERKKPSHL